MKRWSLAVDVKKKKKSKKLNFQLEGEREREMVLMLFWIGGREANWGGPDNLSWSVI